MPYIFIKLAYDEQLPPIAKKLNPAPNHMVWVRGIDFEPVLSPMADIEESVKKLNALKKQLK